MAETTFPHQQLIDLADQYQHFREEKNRKGIDDKIQRKLLKKMEPLEEKFESLLERWVQDEDLRETWRDHFFRAQTPPDEPALGAQPVFVGETETGHRVEVTPRGEELAVVMDGDVHGRIPARAATFGDAPLASLKRILEQDVEERFEASEDALEALRDYAEASEGKPDWAIAPDLYRDGLIDEHFSVTDRGRRFLQNR